MQDTGQDRSEAATPRKREEARKEGQQASSSDLGTAFILCMMLLLFLNISPILGSRIYVLVRQSLTGGVNWREWSMDEMVTVGRVSASFFITTIAAVFAGSIVAGIFSSVMQNGAQFNPNALQWKLSRLSPANGIKKIASWRGLMRTLMAMLKFSLCASAMLLVFYVQWERLTWGSVFEIITNAWYTCLHAGLAGTFCLLLLGVGDYLFQRWQFEEELKMTQQQVKDEAKENQGDPHVKGRIRRLQAESANARSVTAVPKATFVVTNPTHYAIAIRYDRATMAAPKVVAKGKGEMAQRIRRRAIEAGVPVLERKPLARALYASTEVGGEVPTSLYKAVAEILNYVYTLRP